MGLKAKKSYVGKGKGYHGHSDEHSKIAHIRWNKYYQNKSKKKLSKNPNSIHTKKFDRCVTQCQSKKKQTGKPKSCYAVCTKSVGKKHNPKKDYIKGGYADNEPYSKYDKRQLDRGTQVEMEHTNNPKIAREIASDHLEENPCYYDYLDKMESDYEKLKSRK